MTLFRPQRGSLDAAMKEVFEFSGMKELALHIKSLGYNDGLISVEKYGEGVDNRIGWNTHIVTLKDPHNEIEHVVGFTNGEVV